MLGQDPVCTDKSGTLAGPAQNQANWNHRTEARKRISEDGNVFHPPHGWAKIGLGAGSECLSGQAKSV